jgi:hypothetical protein
VIVDCIRTRKLLDPILPVARAAMVVGHGVHHPHAFDGRDNQRMAKGLEVEGAYLQFGRIPGQEPAASRKLDDPLHDRMELGLKLATVAWTLRLVVCSRLDELDPSRSVKA